MGFERFTERFGGITTSLNIYTTLQYTTASGLAKDLGFRLLTVVLLYFNMAVPDFSKSKYLEIGRKVAGWSGLFFATTSLFDAALRPKYKGLRIFDELSILSLFCAMYAVFCWMFQEIGEGFGMSVGIIVGAGLVAGSVMRWREMCLTEQVERINPQEVLEKVLGNLTKEAEENPQALLNLHCLVVLLMAINTEDTSALAILKYLKTKTSTTEAGITNPP